MREMRLTTTLYDDHHHANVGVVLYAAPAAAWCEYVCTTKLRCLGCDALHYTVS